MTRDVHSHSSRGVPLSLEQSVTERKRRERAGVGKRPVRQPREDHREAGLCSDQNPLMLRHSPCSPGTQPGQEGEPRPEKAVPGPPDFQRDPSLTSLIVKVIGLGQVQKGLPQQ